MASKIDVGVVAIHEENPGEPEQHDHRGTGGNEARNRLYLQADLEPDQQHEDRHRTNRRTGQHVNHVWDREIPSSRQAMTRMTPANKTFGMAVPRATADKSQPPGEGDAEEEVQHAGREKDERGDSRTAEAQQHGQSDPADRKKQQARHHENLQHLTGGALERWVNPPADELGTENDQKQANHDGQRERDLGPLQEDRSKLNKVAFGAQPRRHRHDHRRRWQ